MAKKFGKFLFATAALGTAAAAAYYFLQKKDSAMTPSNEDEDYDDFSEDLEEEESTRTYVSLNRNPSDSSTDTSEETPAESSDFTPLAEQINQMAEEPQEASIEESSEEFFDEDDFEEESIPTED